MSAFTIAFQVPNLVRSLFADAAIQAAFVPVFTEQLERGNKREAFRLASTLIFLVTLVLTALTALFILIAPVLMPLFVGSEVPQGLTVTLSQVLFPILVMLGTTGMVVGILNSYDRFGAFAISPFFWNVAIIAVLVGHGARSFTATTGSTPTRSGCWSGRRSSWRSRPGTCATRRSGCCGCSTGEASRCDACCC